MVYLCIWHLAFSVHPSTHQKLFCSSMQFNPFCLRLATGEQACDSHTRYTLVLCFAITQAYVEATKTHVCHFEKYFDLTAHHTEIQSKIKCVCCV